MNFLWIPVVLNLRFTLSFGPILQETIFQLFLLRYSFSSHTYSNERIASDVENPQVAEFVQVQPIQSRNADSSYIQDLNDFFKIFPDYSIPLGF